ncbi:mRNA cap methylation, RNMT-activating mini protein [Ditylenchus destructor]|nr:mRNA cap methylation, RNMT-activating mini protein [Ditylenchus destructor]
MSNQSDNGEAASDHTVPSVAEEPPAAAPTAEITPAESKLEEYEKLFSNRYTEQDADYMKKFNADLKPVHILPWQTRGGGDYGGNGGRRFQKRRYEGNRFDGPADRRFRDDRYRDDRRNQSNSWKQQRDFVDSRRDNR